MQRNSIRIGLFIDENLLKRCDSTVPLTEARSRSEFISNAINYYITSINAEKDAQLILPVLDNALDGRMKDMETRLSRTLFKLAVEVAMMMHVVAGTNEIPEAQLVSLRKLCTDEVARLSGRYNFEDAVKFQR